MTTPMGTIPELPYFHTSLASNVNECESFGGDGGRCGCAFAVRTIDEYQPDAPLSILYTPSTTQTRNFIERVMARKLTEHSILVRESPLIRHSVDL